MKPYNTIILVLGCLALLTCAGSDDPCAVDHIIVNDECIPTYTFPDTNALQNDDKFYHEDFGVITFKNGYWVDEWDYVIKDLENKNNL